MKTQFAPRLAALVSFGLAAVVVQSVPAESEVTSHVMPEIATAGPGVYTTRVRRAQGVSASRRDDVAAENLPTSFRVYIFMHAVKSDWQDTVAVNPEYPSLEMCEVARPDLVDGFLQFMERRYLQPFRVESKCAESDDDV